MTYEFYKTTVYIISRYNVYEECTPEISFDHENPACEHLAIFFSEADAMNYFNARYADASMFVKEQAYPRGIRYDVTYYEVEKAVYDENGDAIEIEIIARSNTKPLD